MRILATIFAALSLSPGWGVNAIGPNGGQIVTGAVPGGPRPALVYLPPGYDTSTRRYPVIYLLHGLPGSPSEYVDGADLLRFADAQIASGAMQPFIAVIPAAGASHSYGGEWAGVWEHYVIHDVIPWTDTHFRTVADRSGRTVAGLSAGGFGAVDIALRNLSLFSAVEAWSGYFVPLRDAPFTHASSVTLRANDPTLLATVRAAAIRRAGVRFFLSTGPTHSRLIPASETISFAHQLQRLGIPSTLVAYPTARGEWRAQVEAGLSWAFGPAPVN